MTDPAFRGRVNRARRSGTVGKLVGRPFITWHREVCRCRVLVAYLRPHAWEVLGERFRQRPAEWLERTGVEPESLTDHQAGNAFIANLRKVNGVHEMLPLDIGEWPDLSLTFEVGCDHAVTNEALSLLADDCLKVKATYRRVERDVGGRTK